MAIVVVLGVFGGTDSSSDRAGSGADQGASLGFR